MDDPFEHQVQKKKHPNYVINIIVIITTKITTTTTTTKATIFRFRFASFCCLSCLFPDLISSLLKLRGFNFANWMAKCLVTYWPLQSKSDEHTIIFLSKDLLRFCHFFWRCHKEKWVKIFEQCWPHRICKTQTGKFRFKLKLEVQTWEDNNHKDIKASIKNQLHFQI